MFEKWAVSFATLIKKMNPEETEPIDVLVFGFTIVFNLLFTFTAIFIIAWFLGVPWTAMQVAVSFMLLRILTGGAHLDRSLACSLISTTLIILCVFLPVSTLSITIYFVITLLLLIRFAPYYEVHQLQHSLQWEQKKKRLALLCSVFALLLYVIFSLPGFVFGGMLQALLLTPPGIHFMHRLNKRSREFFT
ncbi:accessory gene regulator B family protein [Bacillaceae bacterium Marseille-Q3522]|nr:accessory gene regulator B family protein [Bacillaceae bacterium Marseille-Q3522]